MASDVGWEGCARSIREIVREEAVLSSQIEDTQSTLEDVLAFEADAQGSDYPKDVGEVVN